MAAMAVVYLQRACYIRGIYRHTKAACHADMHCFIAGASYARGAAAGGPWVAVVVVRMRYQAVSRHANRRGAMSACVREMRRLQQSAAATHAVQKVKECA